MVDIFQSQDRSTCYGMKANLTCVTVVAGGLLRWSIAGKTVLPVGSGQTASFNQTVNGSTFVDLNCLGRIFTPIHQLSYWTPRKLHL